MRPEYYVGLGKTIYNSSVAIVPRLALQESEIVLTERLTRIKNTGAWPEAPLRALLPKIEHSTFAVVENRDVQSPIFIESYYNQRIPFSERIHLLNLERFSSLQNKIPVLPHHVAHAWSAVAFAPFEDSLVLVLDGAGSEVASSTKNKKYEYLSLFRWSRQKLELLERKDLEFKVVKFRDKLSLRELESFMKKSLSTFLIIKQKPVRSWDSLPLVGA